ncbi:MAG TPA: META domain-containing protein [Longimicrobiaceae bacterium]|nr:META domain-containing protein [Longimicrobiaceae bacterium]
MKAAAFVLLLGAAACSSTSGPFDGTTDPALLADRSWRLERVDADGNGSGAPVAADLSVTFTSSGGVGGMAGPNHYGGSYSASASGDIELSNVTSTLIGGPDAERAGEYLQHMLRAHSFTVTATELRLRFSARGVLIFRGMVLAPT